MSARGRGGVILQTCEQITQRPTILLFPQNSSETIFMGRPPTPTNILEMRGDFKKNPKTRRATEPKPDKPLGYPPGRLQPEVKKAWREINKHCLSTGVLTAIGRDDGFKNCNDHVGLVWNDPQRRQKRNADKVMIKVTNKGKWLMNNDMVSSH